MGNILGMGFNKVRLFKEMV